MTATEIDNDIRDQVRNGKVCMFVLQELLSQALEALTKVASADDKGRLGEECRDTLLEILAGTKSN